MLSTVVSISGMLAAKPAPRAAGREPVAVEIDFVSHAGEGVAGRKRFTRDGCYQTESGGSDGGATYVRDSQAGCYRPADVATVFSRLDAVDAGALVRDAAAGAVAGRKALSRGLTPGDSATRVVLIRSDGSRWSAANQATGDDILRAINELPEANQWHAAPPEKPIGVGPQLLVLSATSNRATRFEAALVSDGRWWCHRSTIDDRSDTELPARKASPMTNADARLRRILEGAGPQAHGDAPATRRAKGAEISIEAAWPDQPRAPLRPDAPADAISKRFGVEMGALSPACALR